MKRILTYRLFESLPGDSKFGNKRDRVPFTRENIQKFIRGRINEKEVESVITDMCADFMDEYNVSIHFNWGWAVKSGGKIDLRQDSTINLIRKSPSKKWVDDGALSQSGIDRYLQEVKESSSRYVEVLFDRYDRGSKSLNIWKEGIESDFQKILEFASNYFQNAEVSQSGVLGKEAWMARFNVIFK